MIGYREIFCGYPQRLAFKRRLRVFVGSLGTYKVPGRTTKKRSIRSELGGAVFLMRIHLDKIGRISERKKTSSRSASVG